MWVELGDNNLVHTKRFAAFRLCHYEDESVIYGITSDGRGGQTVYISGEKDEAMTQFEKLRAVIKDEMAFSKLMYTAPESILNYHVK